MSTMTTIDTLSGARTVTLGTLEDALSPVSLHVERGEILATYFDGSVERHADLGALCSAAKLCDVGDEAADAEADEALEALEVARVRSQPMAERITSIRYELATDAASELGDGDAAKGCEIYESALDALLPYADVTVVLSNVDASRFDAKGDGFHASKRHLGASEVYPTDPDSDVVGPRDGELLDLIFEKAWEQACKRAWESTAD